MPDGVFCPVVLPVHQVGGQEWNLEMSEDDWLTSSDTYALLEYLGSDASSRRLRLLAVACFRHGWKAWTNRRDRMAVVTAETMADGLIAERDIETIREQVAERLDQLSRWADLECMPHVPDRLLRPVFGWEDAVACIEQVLLKAESETKTLDGCREEVEVELAALLRDIVPNPFRPITINPRWRTEDTVGLARGIYEDRAYGRFPILRDALMDAGCDVGCILEHCRADGHVRGCWLVDLVLAKE
jgi:hypothetical protein